MRSTPSHQRGGGGSGSGSKKDLSKSASSKKTRGGGGSSLQSFLRGLCGCCGASDSMRPEHGHQEQATQPIRPVDGGRETPDFESVFTQLGPNDVSYKVRSEPKMVHQYILGDVIGEGSYAKVREAIDSTTNRKVAIKILAKRKLKKLPAGESAVKKEVEVLSKLRHVNIVEHIDYFSIDEKEKIYIVLEYVGGGTLQGLIERATGGIMPRKQAQQIFRQLLSAIEHIHLHNIVHCDIKPDNLMFTSEGVLKMTDFGVAEEISGRESDYEILTKSGGSPAFQPPEVKSGINASSPAKIDIWAIGITLYIIATGKYPFSGTNIYTICENIAKGEYQLPDTLEPDLATLIKGILQLNPSDRYSIQDMKKNSWVVNDIINDDPILPYNPAPADRPTHDVSEIQSNGGQQGYSSGEDEEYEEEELEEPTMFTLDESENSNCTNQHSSGVAPHNKMKTSASLHDSSASQNSSMTTLPFSSLTTSNVTPTKSRRTKSRCSIM